MPLFKRRSVKPGRAGYSQKKHVDMRALRTNTSYAHERVLKIAATRASRFMRALILVTILVVVGVGAVGFLGLVVYSLKSGEKVSIFSQVTDYLQTTPFKIFLKSNDIKSEILQVLGVGEVPEYPESSFVFQDYVRRIGSSGFTIKEGTLSAADAQSLYTFLTGGQSVYRLPVTASWEMVQQYYLQELPKKGWHFESSVPVTDTEKIPGDYYTKDEKGLHLYTVASDIWYETVTKEQAAQGLHDKIVSYKAKQELVAAASGHDLPADAIWKLRYSRDWDVELTKNAVYGVNNIYFMHDTSKEKVTISVLSRFKENAADLTYKELQNVGVGYISTWLTTQQTTVTLQGLTQTERIVADGKALEFTDLKNHAHFLFLLNRKNNLFYVVQYLGKDNPEFFEYIKANLKN